MLSVIIVNYKTSKDISVCLNSIIKYEKDYRKYEIVIVDNNSDDQELKNLEKQFSFVKIIYAPRNGGFAYGNNIGIKNSSGDYVLLLNPDTYLEDDSIKKLYDRMKNDPDIAIAGPKLLHPDRTNQSDIPPKTYPTLWNMFCYEFYLNRIFKNSKIFNSYLRTYMDYDKETLVEQVSGTALMFRRRIIDTIGLLDENYFMFFEESDFCLQAHKNGYKQLYFPGSEIIHARGQTTASGFSERSNKDFIESFIYFFKKNHGLLSVCISMLLLFIGSLIRLIVLRLTSNNSYIIYYYFIKYLMKNIIQKS